eukprot:CAMPEP_0116915204 /NCGR_PEP_ID=MMETSP0467-20121206/17788_1 /TAXON_ID=283647 /ORGANISM="Mesodinium pulex, Strain SPMC105" /LENGTH=71 /DNA_ID=CAMNT_0004591821 /DNA_START=636 /DNA_END=851 /DNA_ORIENTATION=+
MNMNRNRNIELNRNENNLDLPGNVDNSGFGRSSVSRQIPQTTNTNTQIGGGLTRDQARKMQEERMKKSLRN